MDRRLVLLCLVPLFYSAHSLKCYSCTGTDADCDTTEVECPENDMCGASTMIVNSFPCKSRTVYKGCFKSSAQPAKNISISPSKIVRLSLHEELCNTDFCNGNTPTDSPETPNNLYCHSCITPGQECTSDHMKTIRCTGEQTHCLDANIVGSFGGIADTNFKGCGDIPTCSKNLIFAGETSSLTMKCCDTNFCNIATDADDTTDQSPNGVQCYSCNTFDGRPCSPEEVTKAQCYGPLTRCLEVAGIRMEEGKAKPAVIKGCSTPEMCEIPFIQLLQTLASARVECCNGSLCNKKFTEDNLQETGYFPGTGSMNGHGSSSSSTGGQSGSSNVNQGGGSSNEDSYANPNNLGGSHENNLGHGSNSLFPGANGNYSELIRIISNNTGINETLLSQKINASTMANRSVLLKELNSIPGFNLHSLPPQMQAYLLSNNGNPSQASEDYNHGSSYGHDSGPEAYGETGYINDGSYMAPGGSSYEPSHTNTNHPGGTYGSHAGYGSNVPIPGTNVIKANYSTIILKLSDATGISTTDLSKAINESTLANPSAAMGALSKIPGFDPRKLTPELKDALYGYSQPPHTPYPKANYSTLILKLSNATGINTTVLTQTLNESTLANPSAAMSALSKIPGFDPRKLTPEVQAALLGYSSQPPQTYPGDINDSGSYGSHGGYGSNVPVPGTSVTKANYSTLILQLSNITGLSTTELSKAINESTLANPSAAMSALSKIPGFDPRKLTPELKDAIYGYSSQPSHTPYPKANYSTLILKLSNATGINTTVLTQALNESTLANPSAAMSALSKIQGFDPRKLTPELKDALYSYSSQPPHMYPGGVSGNTSTSHGATGVGGFVYNSDQTPPENHNHGGSFGHDNNPETYAESGHYNDGSYVAPGGNNNEPPHTNTNNQGGTYGSNVGYGSNVAPSGANGTNANYSTLILKIANDMGMSPTELAQKLDKSAMANRSSLMSALSKIEGFDATKLTPEVKALIAGYSGSPEAYGEVGHNNDGSYMAPGGGSYEPSHTNTNPGGTYGSHAGYGSNVPIPGTSVTKANYSTLILQLSNVTGLSSTELSKVINESTLANPSAAMSALSKIPGFDPRKLTPELKDALYGYSQPPHTPYPKANYSTLILQLSNVTGISTTELSKAINESTMSNPSAAMSALSKIPGFDPKKLTPELKDALYGYSSQPPHTSYPKANYDTIILKLSNLTGLSTTVLTEALNESTLANPSAAMSALSKVQGFDPRKLTPEVQAVLLGYSSQPPHMYPGDINGSGSYGSHSGYGSNVPIPGTSVTKANYSTLILQLSNVTGISTTELSKAINESTLANPSATMSALSKIPGFDPRKLTPELKDALLGYSSQPPHTPYPKANYSTIILKLSNLTGLSTAVLTQTLNESTLANPSAAMSALSKIPGFDPRKLTPELKDALLVYSSQPPHTSYPKDNYDTLILKLSNLTGLSTTVLTQTLNESTLANPSVAMSALSKIQGFDPRKLTPEVNALILGYSSNHGTSGDYNPNMPSGDSHGHHGSYETYDQSGPSNMADSFRNKSEVIKMLADMTGFSPAFLSQKLSGINVANRNDLAKALSSIDGFSPYMLPLNIRSYIFDSSDDPSHMHPSGAGPPSHNMPPPASYGDSHGGTGNTGSFHDDDLLFPGRATNESAAGNSTANSSAYSFRSKYGVFSIVFTAALLLLT